MNRIKERWYLTLFLIPIFIDWFSELPILDALFQDAPTSALTISILVNLIFLGEVVKHFINKDRYSKEDLKIVEDLLNTFNLEDLQWFLAHNVISNGVRKSFSNQIHEYLYKSKLPINHIYEKRLRRRFNMFYQKLSDYQSLFAQYMSLEGDTLTLSTELKYRNHEEYYKRYTELETSLSELNKEFTSLIDYLKKNRITDLINIKTNGT